MEDKPYAIDVFNRFNDQVQRVVPSDRLLVYDIREGWRPLCEFLGKAVPEGKPFPHRNDAAEFRSRVQRGVLVIRIVACAVLGSIALLLAWLVITSIGL